ncbi:MAG: ABC transporter permease, partial [Oscillospiraceae bacterium]
MKTFDLIQMCLRNLTRRKFRTLLTMIGVVLGTCAVVMMIALGLGMKQSLDESLAQMGDLTLIEIYAYGNVDKEGKEVFLDDAKMKEIMALPGVKTATPFYNPRNFDAQMFGGRNERYMAYVYNIVGVYPEALPLLGYELLEGTWEDAFSEPYSILMGQYAAYQFQDTRKTRGNNRVDPYPDATGKIPDPYVDVLSDKLVIRLGQQSETARKIEYKPIVRGVLKEDYQRGYETSRGMFMSIDDLKTMEAAYMKANNIKVDKNQKKGYDNARVKVSDLKYVEEVEAAIKTMGFETYSMETIRKPMEEQA